MSRKEEFLRILNNFNNKIIELDNSYESIRMSNDYSDSYKAHLLDEKYQEIKQFRTDASNSLTAVIDDAVKAFNDKKQADTQARLNNQGYQAGLANIIRAIENNAVSHEEIQGLYSTYKDDVIALKALNNAITRSGNPNIYPFAIQEDKTTDHLERTKQNIERHIKSSYETELGIAGIKYFIDSSLNDDMFYNQNN